MADKIYVDAVGLEIELDIDPPAADGKWYEDDGVTEREALDISGADNFSILVLKPSGVTATWVATRDGTRHIKYTTVDGDLDEVGKYKLQSYIVWTTPNAAELPGATARLKIYARWK